MEYNNSQIEKKQVGNDIYIITIYDSNKETCKDILKEMILNSVRNEGRLIEK